MSPVSLDGALAPAAAGHLRELVARRELILVTGKGGTGQSTFCATLAEQAARARGPGGLPAAARRRAKGEGAHLRVRRLPPPGPSRRIRPSSKRSITPRR